MSEQKSLEGQKKELLDEELEKTAGGVIGLGGPIPIDIPKTATNVPASAPRPRGEV